MCFYSWVLSYANSSHVVIFTFLEEAINNDSKGFLENLSNEFLSSILMKFLTENSRISLAELKWEKNGGTIAVGLGGRKSGLENGINIFHLNKLFVVLLQRFHTLR